VSVGELLRSKAVEDNGLASILASGQLVDEAITNSLVEERLSLPDCTHGCILDGYPRSKGQATWLTGTAFAPHIVLSFAAPADVLIKRFRKRAQESTRADDVPEVYAERLKLHELESREVLAHFRALGNLKTIDASGGMREVLDAVFHLLKLQKSSLEG